MNIDFGPVTIDCDLQDLSGYDETDGMSILTVTSTCGVAAFSRNFATALLEDAYTDICEPAPYFWGAQFEYLPSYSAGDYSFGMEVGLFDTGEISHESSLVAAMRLQPFSYLWRGRLWYGSGGWTAWSGVEFAFDATYIIRLYTYGSSGDNRHDVLEVWSESGGSPDVMLDQLTADYVSADEWRGVDSADMSLVLYYAGAPGSLLNTSSASICNLYVGAWELSTVLPMIRKHGTLGQKRIQEGGNF